jgi:hypothetical protein
MRPVMVLLAVLSTPALCFGATAEFRVKDVPSATALDAARLEPGTVAFSDHRGDELTDPATGLIRFEDWARARPVQKQFLNLYPGYVEPTVNVTVHGVTKQRHDKLHMYVAEARFAVAKPPGGIDLARYATPAFLEKIDPSIKHRAIAAADAVPNKDPENPYNKRPDRRWCEGVARPSCIESRYQLEGKLPMGVRLANKLEEGDKKIAETVDFQSELRALSPQEIDQAGLAKLTGLDAPVTGVLEQSTFYVNQIMRFGKFLAVFQRHPSDPNRTVVTAFMALGVKSSVLERKKEFERVPILRNLVPAQVLMGASSFNTGTSISAGLPKYARNRIEAVAGILQAE